MKKLANYIDGDWTEPAGGGYIDNVNPATGDVYSLLAASTSSDVDLAVAAASRAFPAWSALSQDERARYLTGIAEEIEKQLDSLALAEAIDTGKPFWLAKKMDIPRSAANFRFFGHAITQFASEAHIVDGQAVNYTRRGPLGVVGCISPWNLPLYLFTWKIAPALAAGNTVVAKPSELAPYTAFLLSEICSAVGLPRGVLNIVHGLGATAGQSIVGHESTKAISFTGGTATGRKIAATAAPMFKKLSLEMGGKNPTVIFNDCDFDSAVDHAVRSAFTNQGEICLCGSRILVESQLYEKFLEAFVAKVGLLKTGDPLDDKSNLGALISAAHMEKVLGYIDLAVEEGGHVLAGGKRLYPEGRCAGGCFVAPTVIVGLASHCRTNQEEIFGPVVSVQPFTGEEEAIALANDSMYGLAASIWTSNVRRAHQIAHRLQFGIVWVNTWLLRDLRTPFGGVKNSGVGREGGWEALRFFTEPQNICIKL